jgi:hypothetical protein
MNGSLCVAAAAKDPEIKTATVTDTAESLLV